MTTLLAFYCVVIVIASAAGGVVPSLFRMTHRRMQMTLSLVAGVMLGVALLHLLPHSIYVLGSVEWALGVALLGLLFMFFMIRMFHFHQHDVELISPDGPGQPFADQRPVTTAGLGRDQDHDPHHDHHHERHREHHHRHDAHQHDITWAGLAFGLSVHTIIDGIALAAAFCSEAGRDTILAGFGVFLAIVLHKPLDALSITSLMASRRWSPTRQLVVNVVFALMCPLGAILFAFTADYFEWRQTILGIALAFSAGVFLCISLGDLLPEVHFHTHDRQALSTMLLLGVGIAFLVELLPGHNHAGQGVPQGGGEPPAVLERDVGD